LATWITGSAGFAGGHLARELLGRGHDLFGIDRAGGRQQPAGVHGLDLELADPEAVAEALGQTQPDAIFHLAAQSSAAASFTDPGGTLRTNIDATVGLLEGIRRWGRRPRLLSVGSCEEYGPPGPGELPLDEGQLLRPASPYAVSKAAQTLLCLHYRRTYGLPIVSTRSFTHTGPGQSDRFVFSSFARQIAEAERGGAGVLKVGNLEATRDVSDVRDIARAYADLVALDDPPELVNVCGGRELKVRRGLELLLAQAQVEITVEQDPKRLRPSDVPRFVGDATRLRAAIGWAPETPIESTLSDLLEWWRAQLQPNMDEE